MISTHVESRWFELRSAFWSAVGGSVQATSSLSTSIYWQEIYALDFLRIVAQYKVLGIGNQSYKPTLTAGAELF